MRDRRRSREHPIEKNLKEFSIKSRIIKCIKKNNYLFVQSWMLMINRKLVWDRRLPEQIARIDLNLNNKTTKKFILEFRNSKQAHQQN